MYAADDLLISPFEREVRELAAGNRYIQDEQEYLVTWDRIHQRIAESFKRRKWWFLILLVMFASICIIRIFLIQQYVNPPTPVPQVHSSYRNGFFVQTF